MAIPTKTALDVVPLHVLKAGNGVFDRPGQYMTIMWKTCGKRRAIVESKGGFFFIQFQGRLERINGSPHGQRLLLLFGEIN